MVSASWGRVGCAHRKRSATDLYKKYSIRLKVVPAPSLIVSTPALQVLCRISVGKKQKSITFFYNPITKTMDPAVCQACAATTTRLAFCDQFHPLCLTCATRCPICRGS